MAGERVGVKGFSRWRRCERSEHPEADIFPRQTLPCCVCRFFWRSDGDYPCVGQHISRRKMPEGYLHLTCEQRCQIYALLQIGHSQAHIARQIGVDPSTISRELVRNTGARGYRFKQAHEKASQNAKRPRTSRAK